MTAASSGDGKDDTGRTAAHYTDALGLLSKSGFRGQNVLITCSGIYGALYVTALDEFVDAALLTADARTDFIYFTGICLVAPLWVCKQRTTQHYHVAHTVTQSLLCHIGIAQLAYGDNGYGYAEIGLDVLFRKMSLRCLGKLQETACGHPCGGMRKPPVVVAAHIHVKNINAGLDKVFHVLKSLGNGTSALELLEGVDLIHPVSVGFFQSQS